MQTANDDPLVAGFFGKLLDSRPPVVTPGLVGAMTEKEHQ